MKKLTVADILQLDILKNVTICAGAAGIRFQSDKINRLSAVYPGYLPQEQHNEEGCPQRPPAQAL